MMKHIQHQVGRIFGGLPAVKQGGAQERTGCRTSALQVCVPAGDEILMAMKVAMAASSPVVLLTARAICDHWREKGLIVRSLGRFLKGSIIFEDTRAKRAGRLSGKAKEAGFESMSHLAKEAGRGDDPTPKDVLAQWAMEIESAALENSTKS
uniref:Uncharacterized protein n=1 Tax=Chromera velia CCMP2878 TaxID=1169474 RepID=A0A0G4HQY1_9ALVE|eukprot:Cvel_30359.t1-p1 / transcript=Cvel_30359.t1 / gene=Cvel_30359 / organism=Chromera_velia_CCMP2878 / gene_product=hypothetical protein / transcript_product=hypothetical protein / location=Cvel_scaffold4315:2124-3178(-) / protein_length=151 / sequence_SO=supercontig / SO=protein_coding / is_pseudo=false